MPAPTDAQKAEITQWIHEAAEAPEEKFLDRLEQRRRAAAEAMDPLTPEQAGFSPADAEWSIDQVGRHIARFLRECSQLSRRLAAGEVPTGERKMGMLDEAPRDFDEVKAAVGEGFGLLRGAILNLRSDCDLDPTYAHPYFGPLNCRQWIAFCFVHVNAHLRQIERIKAAPGYPEQG